MPQSKLSQSIAVAVKQLGIDDLLPYKIDVPPRKEFGDFSTNAAILAGRLLSRNPRDTAENLKQILQEIDITGMISKMEIAGPGFLNIFLSDAYIQQSLLAIHKLDTAWGKEAPNGKKILLEFVSANPTGPLHVGHGRWAVIGDVIANLYEAAGYQVEKEFYVNNIGNQIEMLLKSISAAEAGEETPEGGYGGAYIKEIAAQCKVQNAKLKTKDAILHYIIDQQKEVLKSLGVEFDNWFFESMLHEHNEVLNSVQKLHDLNKTFEEGGAIWFKSQESGDDKNRVLVREDGRPTYFAADIAYHANKFSRGFDRVINIWGTDHHGYVERLKGAIRALGLPVENFEVIIGQLVTLYRGNDPVRMSKRTGEMVTLQEVIEEIGKDATRFFFAATDVNSHLDFDLELAKKQTNDNPIFYVQYAHARICSILKKSSPPIPDKYLPLDASPLSILDGEGVGGEVLKTLTHPAERELMLKLLSWPEAVKMAAKLEAPHRICEYGKELATAFHHFYEKCRVLGNPARLFLVDASRITLRNVLNLLGVSTPETM